MEEMVLHDRDHFRFYLEIDEEVAYILYKIVPGGILDFYKTFVPKILRGQGLGDKLMQAVIEYAQKNELKIQPSCSFVENYFSKNPDHTDLMVS